ncbi:MAG: ABC transporter permease [Synergistaceae bacterium]|nr:ABC transporter permease [Synergistaceae bacterium]
MREQEQKSGRFRRLKEIWRRLRKNKPAMAGLFVLIVFVVLAVFADVIADYDTVVIKQNGSIRLKPPSLDHWFGTDAFGRDIFARIVHGARISLTIGFVTTSAAVVIGGLVGAAVAYWGGWFDIIVMRFCDVMSCIPTMLMALAIVAALGPSMFNLLIAIICTNIPIYIRFIRSTVLTIVDQDYIEAARACGTGDFRIIRKHILVNVMGPIIVQATQSIAAMILTAAALSFLGMGVQPPQPEWGSMLSDSREYMRTSPYLMIFPGMAIVLAALSLNLFGDGLRDALDPRLKS